MNALRSLYALTGALVHPSAAASFVGRDRHQSFIALQLAVTFATFAVAPFYLAFHGAPTAAGVFVFALGLLPLAAAMLAARTGDLVRAHAVAAAACVGIALTLFFGTDVGVGSSLACLLVAKLEAEAADDAKLTRAANAVVAGVGVALAATSGFASSGGHDAAIAGVLALTYAIPLARRTRWLIRRTQNDLDRKTSRALAVTEALGDLLVRLNASGSADHVSAACETLLGASPDDLTGRGLFDRIHVTDRPLFLKAVDDAIHDGATVTALVRVRPFTSEPRHLWIEMRARSVTPLQHGDQAGRRCADEVVAILRDVTAVRDHEAELAKAREAIETTMRSKDHFLANMSHELRTPLNAIIGFSEILGSHTLRPVEHGKQLEYARIIHQSGQHLLSVVNSILDMSKIQSGTFEIIPEPFAVAPLMDLCCDMVTLKASEGRVTIVRDYAGTMDDVVADKRACKQILINLLSNAVKFTPELGRVTLKARLEGTALVVTITDTGIGIAAGDLERLGEPFFQARSSRSRPYEGTGLGLSVVRGLVGLHGGSIAIESGTGGGTAVTVKLPLDCRGVDLTSSPASIDTTRRLPGAAIRHLTSRMKNIA